MSRTQGQHITDLTAHEPRGLDVELEGYAWLPRMLDKARATLAGTAGGYQFGCPVDHTCMARLGVTPELILDLAARHSDDHAVLDELRTHGIPSAADAWFDGLRVEDELQDTGNYLRVRRDRDLREAEGGRAFTGSEHGASVSVVLIEAAAGEAQKPHAHPSRRWSQSTTARRRSTSESSRHASYAPARSSASQPRSRTAGSPNAMACARSPRSARHGS